MSVFCFLLSWSGDAIINFSVTLLCWVPLIVVKILARGREGEMAQFVHSPPHAQSVERARCEGVMWVISGVIWSTPQFTPLLQFCILQRMHYPKHQIGIICLAEILSKFTPTVTANRCIPFHFEISFRNVTKIAPSSFYIVCKIQIDWMMSLEIKIEISKYCQFDAWPVLDN